MSEEVLDVADNYSFSMESGKLKATMQHLVHTTVYTCLRGPRPSGAILFVRMTNSIGMFPVYGHVLPPDGIKSCVAMGECMMENNHCVRCLHAEVSAIIGAARSGQSTLDGVMFSINKPCYNCTLHIIEAGIKRIYYAYAVYDEDRTRDALEVSGVECIYVSVDEPFTGKAEGIAIRDHVLTSEEILKILQLQELRHDGND